MKYKESVNYLGKIKNRMKYFKMKATCHCFQAKLLQQWLQECLTAHLYRMGIYTSPKCVLSKVPNYITNVHYFLGCNALNRQH